MKRVLQVWFLAIIPWTIYRIFFRFPETIDEFVVKPIIFIVIPFILLKAKTIPGFEKRENISQDLTIGAGLGFIFAFVSLLANNLKHQGFNFAPVLPLFGSGLLLYLALSLFTAFSEEILGRGFFYRIFKKNYGVLTSGFFSALLSVSFHLPILVTQLNLGGITLLVFLTSVFLLSLINCYLYENRGNLVLPILLHVFWNMSVALYL